MKTFSPFKGSSLSFSKTIGSLAFAMILLSPQNILPSENPSSKKAVLHFQGVSAIAFSGDQKTVALPEPSGRLVVRRLKDGGVLWATYHCRLSELVYSRDNQLIVSVGGNRAGEHTIKVWSAESGANVLTVTNGALRPRHVLLTPDNCLLMAAFEGGGVACWDVSTGQQRWHRTDLAPSDSLLITPKGDWLQSHSAGHPCTILRVHDGSSVRELTPAG